MMNVVIILLGIPLSNCLFINLTGGNFIVKDIPYTVKCVTDIYKDDRKWDFLIDRNNGQAKTVSIRSSNQYGCLYIEDNIYNNCTSNVCACDADGLATYWTFHMDKLDNTITFSCASANDKNLLITSNIVSPTIAFGPGQSIQFFPANYSVIKRVGQTLGPIICNASCTPPCWIVWATPNSTLKQENELQIKSLRNSDHGVYQCTAGNGYGNNETKDLNVTVFFGPEKSEIFPNTSQYTITEGSNINEIRCVATCRPSCSYEWRGPKDVAVTGKTLNLTNVQRNQTGKYNCTAYNEVGNTSSDNIEVTVNYGPGNSIMFNPRDDVVTLVIDEKLGPVNCTGKCRPPCQFKWNKPDGTSINGSVLEIGSLSLNDHGIFTCTGWNGIGENKTKDLNVTVNFGPKSVVILPANTTYVLKEGDVLSTINCSALCRPQCQYRWYGPNLNEQTNLLSIQNVNIKHDGQYNCTAWNYVGSLMSEDIELDIQYSALVTELDVNGNMPVQENFTVLFICRFVGNPTPIVTWTHGETALASFNDTDQLSVLKIEKVTFVDIGNYSCIVRNYIGKDTRKKELLVNCHPRSSNVLPEEIPVKDENATINITIQIISFPPPINIEWCFSKNGTSELQPVDKQYLKLSLGLYQHVCQLVHTDATEMDYGIYYINVSNSIDPSLSHSFDVFPERIPDKPSNVTTFCIDLADSVVVAWKPGFNGGQPQIFSVWFRKHGISGENFQKYYEDKHDPGRNKYTSIDVGNLQPETSYQLYVNASNSIGFSVSGHVLCNTSTEIRDTDSDFDFLGTVVGISSALVVIIIAIIAVFILRRFLAGKKETEQSRALTRKASVSLDELADNPDYISADSIVHSVMKKSKNEYKQQQLVSTCVDVQASSEYAVVTKNNKRDDVYENANLTTATNENVCKMGEESDNHRRKNADGLQYAELMFSSSKSGPQFVIHGLENRTIYAEVDTTQKIDPLPESDDEDTNK